ncbi:Cap protein [Plakobranchus ocellatus]|uniref:Cap protein n=1 Tax=Plakobranchus ocellatus TaxID=259542 RepID=A0AAV4D775_9GAST|nr:Cap protein [Plakobranchus ocellatus]
MKIGQISLLLAVVVVCPCAVAKSMDSWNNLHRFITRKFHNDFRESENACYMNWLRYDSVLEMEAYYTVQRCDYTFRPHHNFGQNVAYDKPDYDLTTFLEISLQKMMEEKTMYSSNQKSCGKACRYTQQFSFAAKEKENGGFQFLSKPGEWLGRPYEMKTHMQLSIRDKLYAICDGLQAQHGLSLRTSRSVVMHRT